MLLTQNNNLFLMSLARRPVERFAITGLSSQAHRLTYPALDPFGQIRALFYGRKTYLNTIRLYCCCYHDLMVDHHVVFFFMIHDPGICFINIVDRVIIVPRLWYCNCWWFAIHWYFYSMIGCMFILWYISIMFMFGLPSSDGILLDWDYQRLSWFQLKIQLSLKSWSPKIGSPNDHHEARTWYSESNSFMINLGSAWTIDHEKFIVKLNKAGIEAKQKKQFINKLHNFTLFFSSL